MKNNYLWGGGGNIVIPWLIETLKNWGIKKYKIFRPWWNETVLIEWIIDDQSQRTDLNNRIMWAYNNSWKGIEAIEQVGFVNYSETEPELMMAWGEFCWNATRSFAYDYLNWQEWEIKLKVSWVEKKLLAWVNEKGHAWAQMPIYADPQKIAEDQAISWNYIVEMEWITHYVYNQALPYPLDEKGFSEKIKKHAFALIKEKWLDAYPASGIMYMHKDWNKLQMIPVVYVKSINTLFLETACWSWTTALWLVESMKKKQNIKDLEVTQYSWMPIYFSVNRDQDTWEFSNAKISWPISKLSEWTISYLNDQDVIIDKCLTINDLKYALDNWLIKLYQDLFSQAPYFEKYTENEVSQIFTEYLALENNWVYFAKHQWDIIWFGVVVPVLWSSVNKILSAKIDQMWWDKNNCFYMADLWVNWEIQRAWLWTDLVLSRINWLPDWAVVIMRTSVANYKSQWLYKKIWFKKLEGLEEDVSQKRIDELEKKDTRLFLYHIKK